MTEKEEVCIRELKTIVDIREIQKYVKSKGKNVTEGEVVQVCIDLAKRLGANNWGIYLEVKHVYGKCFEEVKTKVVESPEEIERKHALTPEKFNREFGI